MSNLIAAWFSNVDWSDIGWASVDTLQMLGWSLTLTLLLGLPLGVLLFLTSPTQLHDAPRVYGGVSLAVNVLRSLPFVILLIAMIPLTQILTGTSLGVAGSVPALVVAGIPFFVGFFSKFLVLQFVVATDHVLSHACDDLFGTESRIPRFSRTRR